MAAGYSVEVCRTLAEKFRLAGLHRPMRTARYEAGDELVYEVKTVETAAVFNVRLRIENFVGGGFAGQVYRVKVLDINSADGAKCPLEVGGVYAMKILVPPSPAAQLFRDIIYRVGFQGPFQLQVNPAAARSGALWQKFIRRAASIRFGSESAVVDIHATFVDDKLRSCGELSEWVDGRTWRLEVDENLDTLTRWRQGRDVDPQKLGSNEYRAKKRFMADFVKMLHDMGAYEFARQYEWSTCKSQPNCLKRLDGRGGTEAGLTAVDFRAGLALLPFLPMSPGDFKLILNGIKRGSLVQFDRGSIKKLERFIEDSGDNFGDMRAMLNELKEVESIYRDSVPDVTHNHFRLLYSGKLWSRIFSSAITGWGVRNLIDAKHEEKLRASRVRTILFFVIGAIPVLGRVLRKAWGRVDWRRHYKAMLTGFDYLKRAIRGKIAEFVTAWHRVGRIDGDKALKIADSVARFSIHLPLSVLPVWLHRFVTDWRYALGLLAYITVRPVRLYFNRQLREQWLRDMVNEGKGKHIITDEDSETILSQLNEPYIQRYLVSLVVHLLTLPITQIVSGIVAWIFWMKHPEMPVEERGIKVAGILILFQVIPVSPGSFCRGLYTTCLAIYDRNFKDYNIALFLSYFKYIGYLAFPIQMTYHYPAMARFMAGHWATEAVHKVPVFGERGALLEHGIFYLFYNRPLTICRRMGNRARIRSVLEPRYWHVAFCAITAAGIFSMAEYFYLDRLGSLPGLKDIWSLTVLVGLCSGAVVTFFCGGAVFWKRFTAAAVTGVLTALLYTGFSAILRAGGTPADGSILLDLAWRIFVFAVLSTIGAFITELKLPDPELS